MTQRRLPVASILLAALAGGCGRQPLKTDGGAGTGGDAGQAGAGGTFTPTRGPVKVAASVVWANAGVAARVVAASATQIIRFTKLPLVVGMRIAGRRAREAPSEVALARQPLAFSR